MKVNGYSYLEATRRKKRKIGSGVTEARWQECLNMRMLFSLFVEV